MIDSLSQDIISIIIPIYNVEEYLGQCIESVRNQSYYNLEIILVDDGSTDQSGEICNRYARKDPRIKVIHKKNSGPTETRRIGINSATGKYIGFVDADDFIDIEVYQKIYNIAEEYQAEMVHFGYYTDDTNSVQGTSTKIIHHKNIQKRESLLSQLFSLYPDSEICPALWSNMFKREFIVNHYGKVPDSQTYGEDLIVMCHCLIHVQNYVSVPEGFYHYRIREDSLSKENSENRLMEYYSLYSLLKSILIREGYTEYYINIVKKRFSLLSIQLLSELNNFFIPKYKYFDIERLKGKRIILYGAGKVGIDYYHQICKYQNCKLILWLDQKEFYFEYATVQDVKKVKFQSYDIVLIAVYKKDVAEKIRKQLIDLGIDKKTILWSKPVGIFD